MINILPFLLLGGFVTTENDTNSNGYNYKANNCEMTFNMCALTSDNIYEDVLLNFEGTYYFNNTSNYEYRFNNVNLTITCGSYSYYDSLSINSILHSSDNTLHLYISNYVNDEEPEIFIGAFGSDLFDLSYTNGDELETIHRLYLSSFDDNLVDFEFDLDNSTYIDSLQYQINYGLSGISTDYDFIFDSGYQNGFNDGEDVGYQTGYTQGDNAGYQRGYTNGFNDGLSTNGTAITIFSGIIAVGMIPINFFLSIFNFEILGINFTAFVSSLLSVAVVLIVIKRVLSTKDD